MGIVRIRGRPYGKFEGLKIAAFCVQREQRIQIDRIGIPEYSMNHRIAFPVILLAIFSSACLNASAPIASPAAVEARSESAENTGLDPAAENRVVVGQPEAGAVSDEPAIELVDSPPVDGKAAAAAAPGSPQEESPEDTPLEKAGGPEQALHPETIGPELADFPQGVNPLTGLPVDNPALLDLPAVLVSVTNFPVSSRPQAGLSYASQVYEIFTGEGQTRFLAVFYGQYPNLSGNEAVDTSVPNVVGPVRSGRLAYGPLQARLPGSCLIYAGASSNVQAAVPPCQYIYGSDEDDINSAFVDITTLQTVAEKNQDPTRTYNYSGNQFSTNVPLAGVPAPVVNVFYNFYNQSQWVYDPAAGGYLRFNDLADGSGAFTPSTDRLNGEQLVYENVIVLYADHVAHSPTLIDIELGYRTGRAVIFRDGQAFDVFWTTANTEYEKETGLLRPVRFVDAAGNPVPLAPGQSWVHVVTLSSLVWEISPGEWKVRFYAPFVE